MECEGGSTVCPPTDGGWVAQVIDARDPLTYRSTDLEEYARDINASKSSLLLLNKSDLLSEAARVAWADYLDSQGIPHIFWSAKLAAAEADDPEGAHSTHVPTLATVCCSVLSSNRASSCSSTCTIRPCFMGTALQCTEIHAHSI